VTDETCALCKAVANQRLMIGDVNVNTILGRSRGFVIIPALGPLVVGHALVVSAEHRIGVRYLPEDDQHDYKNVRVHMRNYCRGVGDTMLEAEHGARETSLRGPCIRHAHVHILPRMADASKLFRHNSACPPVKDDNVEAVDSYIWLDDGRRATAYDASRVIGQEIRRTIGRYMRIDVWDLAVNGKALLFYGTIAYWSEIGYGSARS